jgi:hypothetical protein
MFYKVQKEAKKRPLQTLQKDRIFMFLRLNIKFILQI